ncbi:rifin [Plasmodium falciparum IGH-CR14]|uniref:Rifin n=1 Tax=Plasmodium falciparum IGH-CR14 TaxID=580059 RepID=A0A0L1IBW8_PLAFA|nr:rifin [Plasmodium falciparum IGH-CR14]
MSSNDNDPDMKSVKKNFDRQTSQRLEEYEERVKDKRQKCKEQRDKDIQKIVLKDKMEKSLEEKIEKGCLKCGCGLGGVAAGIGIIGGIAISELKKAATSAAILAAEKAGEVEGAAKGTAAGVAKVIELVKSSFRVSTLDGKELGTYITATNYTEVSFISKALNIEYQGSNCLAVSSGRVTVHPKPICSLVNQKSVAALGSKTGYVSDMDVIKKTVESIVTDAKKAAGEATEKAIEEVIQRSTAAAESTYAGCQSAIIASVVAIIIIALVMIIIYLILRYRRKKKMKKKAEYTKLLKE